MSFYKDSPQKSFIAGPYPEFSYPTLAVEDLSLKYRDLIDAERKQFLHVENSYNEFITKMNKVHSELESRFEQQQNINIKLKADLEEINLRDKQVMYDYNKKKDTLKKLYAVHVEQTARMQQLEISNSEMKVNLERLSNENRNMNNDLKASMTERNFLEDRIRDLESRQSADMNRLNSTLADKERQLLDREREIDKYKNEIRKLLDDINRHKQELEMKNREYYSLLEQRDIEIIQLRNMVSKNTLMVQEPVTVIQEGPSKDKEIKHLQKDLEYSRSEVERLKREIMFHDKAPIGDPADKEEVERLRKELDRTREEVHKARREKKVEYVEKIVEKVTEPEPSTPAYVFVDKALEIAEKNFHNRLVPYIYTNWKLLFHMRVLNDEYKKLKAESWKTKNVDPITVSNPVSGNELLQGYMQSMADILVFARKSLVEIIFELFVRSSNHAHSKKVNSLILFSINLNESKETQLTVWQPFVKLYFMIREVAHQNSSDNEFVRSSVTNHSLKDIKKTRTADLEFRDRGNSWIETTLESIENRKKIERNEPNMPTLYLFRLLATKYRVLYPMAGKVTSLDPDLTLDLEDRICRAFELCLNNDLPIVDDKVALKIQNSVS